MKLAFNKPIIFFFVVNDTKFTCSFFSSLLILHENLMHDRELLALPFTRGGSFHRSFSLTPIRILCYHVLTPTLQKRRKNRVLHVIVLARS